MQILLLEEETVDSRSDRFLSLKILIKGTKSEGKAGWGGQRSPPNQASPPQNKTKTKNNKSPSPNGQDLLITGKRFLPIGFCRGLRAAGRPAALRGEEEQVTGGCSSQTSLSLCIINAAPFSSSPPPPAAAPVGSSVYYF